ncbi:Peptidase [Planctomycetales bacterium 10988]|nr:Peptidase [Planctomycetales bacterium 10988]
MGFATFFPRRQPSASWLLLLFLSLLLPNWAIAADAGKEKEPRQFERPVLIKAEGVITPIFTSMLSRRIQEAKSYKADLIIIEIDSPGGMVDPAFEVAHEIRKINWAYKVAYVPDECLSAASFIALACNEIVLHPDARIGDAGPIFMDEDSMFRHVPEKIVSDIAQQIRIVADTNKHSENLAEAMVDKDHLVYQVENQQTGEVRFVSEIELDDWKNKPGWSDPKLVPESREGRFLEFTGKRAAEVGLASFLVDDQAELQQKLKWNGPLHHLDRGWVDGFVFFLNLPFVTFLILLLGLGTLYMELQFPGLGIFGILSVVCFALFFWSRFLGGTADVLEVLLFILGVGCVALEIFVIPGFGVAGMAGAALLLSSILLAGQHSIIPDSREEFHMLILNMGIVGGVGVTFACFVTVMSQYVGSLPVFNRIVLVPPEDKVEDEDAERLLGAKSLAMGQEGVALTALRPIGKVRFGKMVLDVVAEDDIIPPKATVQVVEMDDFQVVVRRKVEEMEEA